MPVFLQKNKCQNSMCHTTSAFIIERQFFYCQISMITGMIIGRRFVRS